MNTTHASERREHPGTCPATAGLTFATGSMEATQASIAEVYSSEYDRLLRQAYRLLSKTPGADIESVPQDAYLKVMAAWETIADASHCRKLLATAVRGLCLNVIATTHDSGLEVSELYSDPSSRNKSRATEHTTAWLFGLCADDTERLILTLWLESGNQTAASTAAASQAGVYVIRDGIRRWFKPAWTVLEVNQLMRRLRQRMGVQLACARSMRFTTKGTLPGLHFESFRSVGCTLLMQGAGAWSGPRPIIVAGVPKSAIPAIRWERGEWVHGTDTVLSYRVGAS